MKNNIYAMKCKQYDKGRPSNRLQIGGLDIYIDKQLIFKLIWLLIS